MMMTVDLAGCTGLLFLTAPLINVVITHITLGLQ